MNEVKAPRSKRPGLTAGRALWLLAWVGFGLIVCKPSHATKKSCAALAKLAAKTQTFVAIDLETPRQELYQSLTGYDFVTHAKLELDRFFISLPTTLGFKRVPIVFVPVPGPEVGQNKFMFIIPVKNKKQAEEFFKSFVLKVASVDGSTVGADGKQIISGEGLEHDFATWGSQIEGDVVPFEIFDVQFETHDIAKSKAKPLLLRVHFHYGRADIANAAASLEVLVKEYDLVREMKPRQGG